MFFTVEGLPGPWLRWCDAEGHWLLTDTEQERQAREQEWQAKEQAQQQALEAQAQAEKLAAQLRALGIEPEIK